MTLEFRDEVPDRDAYFRLFESTGWNAEYHATAEDLHRAIRESWYLTAAWCGEELVGTGRVLSDGVFHGLIVDVIVAPAYQRQGLGARIMARLLDRCREARLLDVQLFCAKGKAPFYHRLGFVDRPADGPGMDYRPAGR
jgi:GNAT superfamily N-acetyltransferase